MNQRIGNIGFLNLINATEESIKGIEEIENVGMVLYKKENVHFLSALNIGNIGATIEVPDGYHFYDGNLKVDKEYLQSISEPSSLFVEGAVIIDRDVQENEMKAAFQNIIVNGKVYCPAHLSGSISHFFSSKGSIEVVTFDGTPPRFEKGKLKLTNAFLKSIEEPQYLVVKGVLSFSKDLNMDKFVEKIGRLEVSGKIHVYEEQEVFLYNRIASLTSSKVEIVPEGYQELTKSLRLNARSIRRFQNQKLYTKKPIIVEADVSRELLSDSIANIHSSSFIICHENVEDLIYELCDLLDTEVLSYQHSFHIIEGEEVWSNDQFLALENPINIIVNGQLILDQDVKEEVIQQKVLAIDIFGEVIVPEKRLKGSLQDLIRVNTGSLDEAGKKERVPSLNNIGKLSL